MCLSSVTKRYKTPKRKETTAYKTFGRFIQIGKRIYAVGKYKNSVIILTGKWVNDTAKGVINKTNRNIYRKGFHAYTTQVGDSIPIKVKNIVVEGTQWSTVETVVARKIFIPTPTDIKYFPIYKSKAHTTKELFYRTRNLIFME